MTVCCQTDGHTCDQTYGLHSDELTERLLPLECLKVAEIIRPSDISLKDCRYVNSTIEIIINVTSLNGLCLADPAVLEARLKHLLAVKL